MCGRFVSKSSPQQLADYFSVDELAVGDVVTESYNVAPTNAVMAVTERAPESASTAHRVLADHRWGLIPSWAKDRKIGNRMINARAETVAEKPAYKRAFAKRRCLIPADGFYEWKRLPDHERKQPYFIRARDGAPIALAGLWERWRDPEGDDDEPLRSCTIITTGPNGLMAAIHDRMPVILPREHWDAWLDPQNDDLDALAELLVPAPDDLLEGHPVTTRVNDPRRKGPENLEPDPEPLG